MSTQEKIGANLKEAMKAGQSFETGVFRMLLASFHNKEIEKKGKRGPASEAGREEKLSEEEVIEILGKEAKKRKESISAFEKGGRNDLAEKEKKELEIIGKYLPEQLNREEIEKAVLAAIEKTGANKEKDPAGKPSVSNGASFGKIMGEVMKELRGKADASIVGEILKEKLK